jgi:hypothetical protein
MTNQEIPFLQALRAEFRSAATRENAMDAESSETHGRRWALPAAVARQAGRGRILVGGGGLVGLAAVALAVLVLTATNATPPAWAVADHHDGTATVTLRQISAIGPLNARLTELGIRSKAVPVRANCKDRIPLGYSHWKTSLGYKVTIGNRWLQPGWTGIMAVKQDPHGGIDAAFAAVPPGHVPDCVSDVVLQPLRP